MSKVNTVYLLTNRKAPGKIKDLELDVTIRESHNFTNDITEFPIENGSTITDHVRQLPDRLTMEGLITNTPVVPLNSIIGTLVRKDNSNRNETAFNELLTMGGFSISKQPGDKPIRTGPPQIIDVVTTLRLYTGMIISNISVTVDKDTDNALYFTVEFRQASFVDSDVTIINKASSLNGKAKNIKNQNSPTVDNGKTSTQKVDKGTVLYNAGKTVRGWLGK
jgi:hypothetical protein